MFFQHNKFILIFSLFNGLHFLTVGIGVFFPHSFLSPWAAWSVYLPLMPLSALGLPVFTIGESGGWVSPSLLGWLTTALFWVIIWWVSAVLAYYHFKAIFRIALTLVTITIIVRFYGHQVATTALESLSRPAIINQKDH
ncbi:MAG: hypothetical protein HOP04_01610 [Methylophilaceae bacterium]|nr:hypothetical protein [Methylophilaceae bacterium]